MKRVLKLKGSCPLHDNRQGSIYLTREEGTETENKSGHVADAIRSIYLTREEGTETSGPGAAPVLLPQFHLLDP